jgi:hypothetical protein
MSISNILSECPDYQERLQDKWDVNPPLIREPINFIEVLNSEANRNDVSIEVAPGEGKLRNYQVRYGQYIGDSRVSENVANPYCNPTGLVGDLTKTYTIDPDINIGEGIRVTAADLRRHCERNADYVLGQLERMLIALDIKLAAQTATQALGLIGKYATNVPNVTSDALIVETLINTNEMAPFTAEDIQGAAMMSLVNSPIIVGGMDLWKYFRRALAGCCGDSAVDIAEMLRQYGQTFFYDRRLATALGGEDYALMFAPGAIQKLYYTQHQWKSGMPEAAFVGSNYVSFGASTPSGAPVDVTIKDDCGALTVGVVLTHDTVGLPDNMFLPGSVYEGITFVNKIRVVNT